MAAIYVLLVVLVAGGLMAMVLLIARGTRNAPRSRERAEREGALGPKGRARARRRREL